MRQLDLLTYSEKTYPQISTEVVGKLGEVFSGTGHQFTVIQRYDSLATPLLES